MQSVKDREFLYSLMICGLLSALNCSPYIIGFQRSCDRYITILLAFMVLPTMLIYQKMVTKLDILYLDNNRYTTRPTPTQWRKSSNGSANWNDKRIVLMRIRGPARYYSNALIMTAPLILLLQYSSFIILDNIPLL